MLRVFITAYRQVAIFLLTAVLLLVAWNLAWVGGEIVVARVHPAPMDDPVLLGPFFPDLTPADIRELRAELNAIRAPVFADFFESKEATVSGRFVAVSPEGFRYGSRRDVSLHDQRLKVCLFGSSSMWGFGVDDGGTIAARLQQRFDSATADRSVSVFNLGHLGHNLDQEAAQFAALGRKGVRCDRAVFFTGYNELRNDRPDTSRLTTALFAAYADDTVRAWRHRLWLLATSQPLYRRVSAAVASGRAPRALTPSRMLADLEATRQLVLGQATAQGTRAFFVIEPSRCFHDHFEGAPFHRDCRDQPPNLVEAMSAVAATADRRVTVDLSTLFDTWSSTPYIDGAHYTREGGRAIADALFAMLSGDHGITATDRPEE